MVMDAIETVCPAVILDESIIKSVPEVPALASSTNVPAESVHRHHVGVPVLFADVSEPIALMVSTPFAALPAQGSVNVCSDRMFVAVPPVAGRVPS